MTQSCLWKFLIFSDEFELSLDVQECVADRTLSYQMDSSKFMRFFEGRWAIRVCTPPANSLEIPMDVHGSASSWCFQLAINPVPLTALC